MARIRDIQRTAAFAWSPNVEPYLATGTQAGAVSADFSDNIQLELWDMCESWTSDPAPVASVNTDSKFYDIAWGQVTKENPRGIISGALENGSLALWSADALVDKLSKPLISRTVKHTGAIKSLQFNPFKPELLATAGAKCELYVWDLNNTANSFMLGNKVSRVDDYDCLDWNKKVSQILVTGGNGGFLTVWDVRTKKESLTLNNLGRKPVSAVSWHPEQQTKLVTATPDDTNPVILVWDLRNSNAPEKTLTGHTSGVLSLSWCKQDIDLLLSCGKDNRTICWNPQTADMLGEFPVVTNWTFKTSFNPRYPNYFATASYDGKVVIRTLQNTNPGVSPTDGPNASESDVDDFFSRASNAQTSSFSLKRSPQWLRRPAGANFGFGGRLVSFYLQDVQQAQPGCSIVRISTVAVDSGVNLATKTFETAFNEGNLESICEKRFQNASSETEKTEWKILRSMFQNNVKKRLIEHLSGASQAEMLLDNVEKQVEPEPKGETVKCETSNKTTKTEKKKGTSFDDESVSDNALEALSSMKQTRATTTHNPFQLYALDQPEADRAITQAIVLGDFEGAVDTCLKEGRMSDAFMLAICGGKKCTEKVTSAYFTTENGRPTYLRVLASIVDKNLWDVVHNADLESWKDVMIIICTFAADTDYCDLCEALGDHLEAYRYEKGGSKSRGPACFCYLAGSKLDKLVPLWIEELHETEKIGLQQVSDESTFSVHARSLQNFIEKVTVFREAVGYVDDGKNLSSGWKLEALYAKYCEYADIVASQGQLEVAAKYLDFLPVEYTAGRVARSRIKEASARASLVAPSPTNKPQQPSNVVYGTQMYQQSFLQQATPATKSYESKSASLPNQYTPSAVAMAPSDIYNYAQQQNVYQPSQPQILRQFPGQYTGHNTFISPPPPQRQFSPASTLQALPNAAPVGNWNDTPADILTKVQRRQTPSVSRTMSPLSGAPPMLPSQPGGHFRAPLPKSTPPPPPKNAAPPQRVSSPASHQLPPQPASTTTTSIPYSASSPQPEVLANSQPLPSTSAVRYMPQPVPPVATIPNQTALRLPQSAVIGRTGFSPQYAPLSNTPTYLASSTPYISSSAGVPQGGVVPSPPSSNQYAPSRHHELSSFDQHVPRPSNEPAIPPAADQLPEISTQVSQAPRYPPGDRSHIPAQYIPLYEILSAEMGRVKIAAPPEFQRQVKDTEKRLNVLFDHINNEELLSAETLQKMGRLAKALANKDYAMAHNIQVELVTNKTSECDTWMTGVKRLIDISRVTAV